MTASMREVAETSAAYAAPRELLAAARTTSEVASKGGRMTGSGVAGGRAFETLGRNWAKDWA